MTNKQPRFDPVAFGPIERDTHVGLTGDNVGDCMVAFVTFGIPEFGEGGHTTVLVDGDMGQMLAQGILNLDGGFGIPFASFKAYRPGWWTEWENPDDASQWLTPDSGAGS